MPPTSGTWIRQFWPERALGIEHPTQVHAGRTFTKTHENGWTITARLYAVRDRFFVIHEFNASHAVHGRVHGDLQASVHATTEQGYQSFMDEFPYTHSLLPSRSLLALAAPWFGGDRSLDSIIAHSALTAVLRANI
jgi:hypothetical protein